MGNFNIAVIDEGYHQYRQHTDVYQLICVSVFILSGVSGHFCPSQRSLIILSDTAPALINHIDCSETQYRLSRTVEHFSHRFQFNYNIICILCEYSKVKPSGY